MKVLLTGATGYIGRRLKKKLLSEDVNLRVFVRNKRAIESEVEVVQGDTFNKEALDEALNGIDVAYYLIHSLQSKDYKNLDKLSAQNFLDSAIKNGVKKIIYLGGLGVKNSDTSEHLLSRIETGEVLSSKPDKIETIWIRAGVIIGSGSASFEIIRNLTEKLPIMITPTWVDTKAQPIGVDNVISYLNEAKDLKTKENLIVDIGTDKMSYKEMMRDTAKALDLKRFLISTPVLSINLSSYWLNIFTPIPFNVAKALIEGMKSEVVMQNENAKKYFPQIEPMSYSDAVKKAIKELKENQVISRWNDVGGKVWEKVHKKEIADAIFVDRQIKSIKNIDKRKVYESFISIGGKNGWFDYDFLWEIRGIFDKLIGGVGLNRGRRDECDLRVGDCLDFWKVVELIPNERVLLYAQMKLPGEAWLEFKIEDDNLIQSAYFYPKGVWGRLYWYSMLIFHYFIFKNLIKSIVEKAKS